MSEPALDIRRVYEPEWHQFDFHNAREYPFRWLCCGVGGGKSWAGVEEMLAQATVVNPGCPGLIVVPDYSTYHDIIRPIIIRCWPEDVYDFRVSGNRPAIEVYTNQGSSWIYIRSAHDRRNVAKIIGLTVAWVYLEEACSFKFGELAWKYSLERLRYPAPNNNIFITTTPKPGWLPRVFEVADGLPVEALREGYSPKADYWVRQAKTEWNTHNPDHYAKRMRTAFGEGDFAAQELDGAIVQSSGLIYPDFAQGLHVIPHRLAVELLKRTMRSRANGADWGWTAPGATIRGGWAEDGGTFVVVGEWYKPGCQVEQQGAETYNDDELPALGRGVYYCDNAEPRNIDKWRRGFEWKRKRYTVKAKAADKAWQAGTDAVRNLMHRRSNVEHVHLEVMGAPRLYISDRCVNLIRELKEYRDANDPEDDAPPKEGATVGDDHAIDALRYAVYTSRVSPPPRTSWESI